MVLHFPVVFFTLPAIESNPLNTFVLPLQMPVLAMYLVASSVTSSLVKPLKYLLLAIIAILPSVAAAADSVDVTFRYSPPASPPNVFLPGEFNGWNNSAWPMTNQGGGVWTRTVRLRLGGNPSPPPNGVPGAWQYKFYYSGVTSWPNDPVDHHINTRDNDNSYIYVKDPTIYQLLPNQRNPIVLTSFPTISAYIFPKVGSVVDTATLAVTLDGLTQGGLGQNYNFVTKQFLYTPTQPLPNGSHTLILTAGGNSDTVTFTTRGGYVQLLNQFPFTTWKEEWVVNGTVEDSNVTSAWIVRNFVDSINVAVVNGGFSTSVPLIEGNNVLVARADSAGTLKTSSQIVLTRRVSHEPYATVAIQDGGGTLTLDATGSSDPDSGQAAGLTFLWSEDPNNPESLPGLQGATANQILLATPSTPGEYYVGLIASDANGNKDTTRSYFIVGDDLSISIPTIANNPKWAQEGRIYFLFPKAASPAGNLNGAASRLQNIKDLGFNIIWLMPVMKNAYPIDNGSGPGYNIIDFYNVAPEYGSNQDFKNFVDQAHALGLRVILDVTPNHSSRFHPWAVDAHTYKSNSAYWDWYEHATITGNTNGLGDCLDPDAFNYYCGFGDQLLNLNWEDIDLRNEMINVYTYWIREFGLDGYRFDVYWGPHRRYGEAFMGKPVRDALKHIKPDILLLGEDDGTGAGTESIYADYASGPTYGGLDAAYDFKLYFNQIQNFGFSASAITNLHNEIDNNGFHPGEHSLYMRFMESQDEDRIVYFYSNASALPDSIAFRRTMPMASVLFTAPGIPMIWNGQEIGWGYGIPGSRHARSRSFINWNYHGRYVLAPHYQRLAHVRAQFPAFSQHRRDTNGDGAVNSGDSTDFARVTSSNGLVYAFSRPFMDQSGLTVVNVSGAPQSTILNLLSGASLIFSGGVQSSATYILNDLYSNARSTIQGSGLDSVHLSLPAYGTAVFTVSTTMDSLVIANPILDVFEGAPIPEEYSLSQNYPNPFNPLTTIEYELPRATNITLQIFDVLGRSIETIDAGQRQAGRNTVVWNAANVPSGVYFYRLSSPEFVSVKKMMLLR